MPADVFFDTAILIYAVSEDAPRAQIATELLSAGGTLSVQVLNEFALVARRKLGMSWEEVKQALGFVRSLCQPPVPLTTQTHERGIEIAARYRFHVFDSMILAAALESRCKTLLTEDLHDGQMIETLTIRNPFLTH
jgi:predicted nucleic acid-binding protein